MSAGCITLAATLARMCGAQHADAAPARLLAVSKTQPAAVLRELATLAALPDWRGVCLAPLSAVLKMK